MRSISLPLLVIQWALGAVAAVILLFLADQVLLWMERRDWIDWRKNEKTPDRASLGSAALEIQILLEPEKRYVLELKREEKTLEDDEGGPDTPHGEREASARVAGLREAPARP